MDGKFGEEIQFRRLVLKVQPMQDFSLKEPEITFSI